MQDHQHASASTVPNTPVQGDATVESKLAIVIPTLHEAENIRELLNRISQSLSTLKLPYECLVVDDDSRDGIEAIVQELSDRDARIRMVVRKNQRSLAGAILYGWRNTDAEILGVMDADLQHPPELLPQLRQALLDGADIAVASRWTQQGGWSRGSRARHWISRLANAMTWPLQKPEIRVADPMSGFFLVRRSCIENIQFQTQGFKLLLEILVRGRVHSVKEVPFSFGRRRAGRSKASLHVAWQYLRLLARLWKNK
jgi:dolichol-phosphate mannosyltransferase